MSDYGFLIFIIYILTFCLFIGLHSIIKKVLVYDLFWKILSILWLVIFISFRTIPDILADDRPNLYQAVFLTDLCPAIAIIIPILFFFKRTRIIAKAFSIWMLLSSIVVGYALFQDAPDEDKGFFNWFFYGGAFNGNRFGRLHILMHYFIFIFSMILILDIKLKEMNYKFILINVFSMLVYLIYVYIVKVKFDLKTNVSGLSEIDWSVNGEYSGGYKLFKMSYPGILFLSFGIIFVLDILSFYFILLIKRHRFKIWNDTTKF